MEKNLKNWIYTALLMALGLALFKFLPMYFFGENILFDASMHIVVASFVLYSIYLTIHNKKIWKASYIGFSLMVLILIAIERIISYHHNLIGVLFGFAISIASIIIPRTWRNH